MNYAHWQKIAKKFGGFCVHSDTEPVLEIYHANFSGQDMNSLFGGIVRLHFYDCNFSRALFEECRWGLAESNLYFGNCNFSEAYFIDCEMRFKTVDVLFTKANILNCRFHNSEWTLADMNHAKIQRSQFDDMWIAQTNFDNTWLSENIFAQTDFRSCTFRGSTGNHLQWLDCNFYVCELDKDRWSQQTVVNTFVHKDEEASPYWTQAYSPAPR